MTAEVRCAVCGETRARPVRELAESTVYECAECGLAFCHPLPPDGSSSSGPTSVMTAEDYTAHLLELTPEKKRRYRAIAGARYRRYARALGKREFDLLEIGCGSAGLSERYEELGVRYLGLDIDARVVEATRKRGKTNVEHRDVLTMGNERTFDVVCASQVLEHSKQPVAFVEKVFELLRPGGVLHVDVPNHESLAGLAHLVARKKRGNRYKGIQYPHHSFAYRKKTLEHLAGARFDVRIFGANPTDRVWGQVQALSVGQRAFFALSKLAHAPSILVAFGTRR